MVEQRPFKALVEGSSPSQPTPLPALRILMNPHSAGLFCASCRLRTETNKNEQKRILNGKYLAVFSGVLRTASGKLVAVIFLE